MPKKSIFDRYETYDTSAGYGNPDEWRKSFNTVVGTTSTIDAHLILGISKNSSEYEIKRAYRSLAKQFHTDKNPDGQDSFIKISQAYKIALDLIVPRQTSIPMNFDVRPQLLNEIEEDELESYLKNPLYCMQEKFDGRRRLLKI